MASGKRQAASRLLRTRNCGERLSFSGKSRATPARCSQTPLAAFQIAASRRLFRSPRCISRILDFFLLLYCYRCNRRWISAAAILLCLPLRIPGVGSRDANLDITHNHNGTLLQTRPRWLLARAVKASPLPPSIFLATQLAASGPMRLDLQGFRDGKSRGLGRHHVGYLLCHNRRECLRSEYTSSRTTQAPWRN